MKSAIIDLKKPIWYSMESFSELTEKDVVSEDESGIVLHPTLIELDKISGNRSRYGSTDFIKSLNESIYFQRRFRANQLFGELEHPFRSSSLERIYHIEPTRYAWQIENYEVQGSIIKGTCRLADPLGMSIIAPNMKRSPGGANIAASLRSITEHVVERQDPASGKTFLDKVYPIKIITFDLVTLPGYEDARLLPPEEFNSIRTRAMNSKQQVNSMESLVPINGIETAVRQLALRGDESLDIIQDLYGIDISKAKNINFIDGSRMNISFENGEVFSMATDDYFMKEIL